MFTLATHRLTAHSDHDDGPYLAFATILLDLAMVLALVALFGLKAGGVLMILNIAGWVLALVMNDTSKHSHARHLNRKASR